MQHTAIHHPLFVVPKILTIPMGVNLLFYQPHLALAAVGQGGVV